MTPRLVRFGYVTVTVANDCLIGARGSTIRGHSFHYSRIVEAPAVKTSYKVRYSISDEEEQEGYSVGNVLASYVHLHFRTAPSIARHLVEAARAAKPVEVFSV